MMYQVERDKKKGGSVWNHLSSARKEARILSLLHVDSYIYELGATKDDKHLREKWSFGRRVT